MALPWIWFLSFDWNAVWKHPVSSGLNSCGRHRYPASASGLSGSYSLACRAVHSPLRRFIFSYSVQIEDTPSLLCLCKAFSSFNSFKHPRKDPHRSSYEIRPCRRRQGNNCCRFITLLLLSAMRYKVQHGKPVFPLEDWSGSYILHQDDTSCLDCIAFRCLIY